MELVKEKSEIKCFAATNSFWLDPQGHVRPCARFKGRMKHLSEFDDFSKVTQSEEYKKLREDHAKGEWTKGCRRCKEDEEKGLSSKRSFYNRLKASTENDFMIDISFGNYCNLKCRMCNPLNSTLWAKDQKSLYESGVFKTYDPELYKAYNMTNDDHDRLINFMSTIKGNIFIEFKGGEPLLMKKLPELLKRISELDCANRVTVLFVTNATSAPDWLNDVSKKLKELQLIVSIDAVGELYNYIRGTRDHKYQDCLENVHKFSKMENLALRFNVVAQNLNIHQLIDLYLLLTTNFNDKINFITLSAPEYLQVNVMADDCREKIWNDYLLVRHKIKNKHKEILENIFKLLLKSPEEKDLKRFPVVMGALDKIRDQDLFKSAPHLIEV